MRQYFLLAGLFAFIFAWAATSVEADLSQDELQLNMSPDLQRRPKSRQKRTALSLPSNTSIRVAMDAIFPIAPMSKTGTFLTIDLPFRFVLPTYDQLVATYSTYGRYDEINEIDVDQEFLEEQRANQERRNLYKILESVFSKFGLDGSTCIKRAICELADAPLGDHGLFGKLAHLFFSPAEVKMPKEMESILKEKENHPEWESLPEWDLIEKPLVDEYTEAYRNGHKGKCWSRYYACPLSIFDFFHV